MATPYSRSNSNGALSTGPSRTLLQQLLEEINGALSTRISRNESPPQRSASISSRSSSLTQTSSPWAKGSSLAQDAHDKLQAADEARRRRAAAAAIDGAHNLQKPRLCLDMSRSNIQDTTLLDEQGSAAFAAFQRTPDPVGYPHEYMQHMMKRSPLSTDAGLSPGSQGRGKNSLHLQAPPVDNTIPPLLSPLIFSDVFFDDSSSLSPQTDTTVSPTEAPTSTATVYTAEKLPTPTGDHGLSLYSSAGLLIIADPKAAPRHTRFLNDSLAESASQKKRTMTVPNIQSKTYFEMAVDAAHECNAVGDDNRCLLRHETFTERAPIPRFSVGVSMDDILPELSSFRPTAADPQGWPSLGSPSQISRMFTSPTEPASAAVPDTPTWMRPMHLVDTGGKSIYTNVHDDGPIHNALCLWCFRTQGSFRKVHKHGYESCGRKEVLDSHYWEDDRWPEDSSDESADSDG